MTAKKSFFDSVAVIGPGLLGGSILKAVRKHQPKCELRIWARRFEALAQVEEQGLADFCGTDLEEVVSGVQLVILAMPIQFMEGIVSRFPPLADGCVVTDVGSTKFSVVRALSAPVKDLGGEFIGSHPMAGSEKTGIEYATAELLEGASVIVTPDGDSQNVERLAGFWQSLGSQVSLLSPEEHDRAVSSISHLPHLVASSLVLSTVAKNPDYADYSGGGFRDTTRIASGDPDMWAEIMIDNQKALLSGVEGLIEDLSKWQEALSGMDKDALRRFLSEAKECRDKVKDR